MTQVFQSTEEFYHYLRDNTEEQITTVSWRCVFGEITIELTQHPDKDCCIKVLQFPYYSGWFSKDKLFDELGRFDLFNKGMYARWI